MSSAFWRCSAGQLYGLREPDLARGPLIEDPCCRQSRRRLGAPTSRLLQRSTCDVTKAMYCANMYACLNQSSTIEHDARSKRIETVSITLSSTYTLLRLLFKLELISCFRHLQHVSSQDVIN